MPNGDYFEIPLKPSNQLELAKAVVGIFEQYGCMDWGIAPGSRSTPLVTALYERGISAVCHTDERGLGFWALGSAKITGRPAVVVVTSGTAVANLLPAIIEAHYSGTPMIVITADRPHDQVGVDANQAIHQTGLLTPFATAFDLPVPATTDAMRHWLETTHFIANMTTPVHLNLRFHDPFDLALPPLSVPFIDVTHTPNENEWVVPISENGMVMVGHLAGLTMAQRKVLGEYWAKSGVPVVVDGPSLGAYETMYPYRTGMPLDTSCDLVWVGGRLHSKALLHTIQHWKGHVVQIHPQVRSHDPLHRSKKVLLMPYESIRFPVQSYTQHGPIRDAMNKRDHHIADLCRMYPNSELSVIGKITAALPDDWVGLIGNSLPIRWWSAIRPLSGEWVMNRGSSGIDGMVATAAGMMSHQPVLAILGDQTVWHDIASLPMWRGRKGALVIVNNNGGRIFKELPIRDHGSCESYFVAPHGQDFEWVSKLMGHPYWRVDTIGELDRVLPQLLGTGGVMEWVGSGDPIGLADL